MSDQRPTPETDAIRARQQGLLCGGANLDHLELFERQRDEAREVAQEQRKRLDAMMNLPGRLAHTERERDEARELARELRDALSHKCKLTGGTLATHELIAKANQLLP